MIYLSSRNSLFVGSWSETKRTKAKTRMYLFSLLPDQVTWSECVIATCACGGLTVADRVTGRRALSNQRLDVVFTDGAGQAGVEGALSVRVGIVLTLLTHRVVIVFAVRVHALTCRAHRTWRALA